MSTSSSTAAERDFKREFLKIVFVVFGFILICFSIFFVNHHENNKYIIETLELNGSAEEGDALFKINCVGCHGITARGLVGPDLHSITQRLNDKEIIKQVTGGLTPPMPSFEIDPVNMSNLLIYLQKIQKMNLFLHQSFHKRLEPNHNQKLLFEDHQKPYNV